MKKSSFFFCLAGFVGFVSGCTLQGQCKSGEIVCAEGNDNKAYIEYCSDGIWVRDPTPCASGKCAENHKSCAQAECFFNGDVNCDGKTARKCEDGSWIKTPCEIDCYYGICTECNQDDTKCENGTFFNCTQGKWSAQECAEGKGCLDDGSACRECDEGETTCDKQGMRTCQSGKWSDPVTCDNGCTPDLVKCIECSGAQTQCVDNMLQTCINGQFVDGTPCEYGCTPDNAKCAECKDDIAQCAGKDAIQKCTNGILDAPEKCAKGLSCSNGKCDSACQEGAVVCDEHPEQPGNDAMLICKNGQWTVSLTCEFGCAADKQNCADCKDNSAATCEDAKLKKCEGGRLSETACPNNYSCKGDECGLCKDGSEKCENGKLKTCIDGNWNEGIACEGGADCKSERECGTCKNSSAVCTNDGAVGKQTSCEQGTPIEIECLRGNASCKLDGKTCGECLNGKTECLENQIRTCKDGVWSTPARCSDGCNDAGTGCKIVGTCTEDKCTNGMLSKCINGKYAAETPCAFGSCKNDGKTCGICTDNTTECENKDDNIGWVKTCLNGEWNDPVSCQTASCNPNTNKCGHCVNTSSKCANKKTISSGQSIEIGQISQCNDGEWTSPTACENGNSCKNNVCGDCINRDTKCTNRTVNGKDVGELFTCKNGTWPETGTACSQNNSCANNKCGICQNGATGCQNDKNYTGFLVTCENGTAQYAPDPCPNNASCNGDVCGECIDYDSKDCTENDTNGIGQATLCFDGKWQSSACQFSIKQWSYKASCDDEQMCGYCVDGEKKCKDDYTFQTCRKGAWADLDYCDSFYICNKTTSKCEYQGCDPNTLCYQNGEYTETDEIPLLQCNSDDKFEAYTKVMAKDYKLCLDEWLILDKSKTVNRKKCSDYACDSWWTIPQECIIWRCPLSY